MQDNKYQLVQIAKMYNISYPTISRFNQGKICKNPDLDYPIRPRSKKVCKPVETIPS